ncbi:MAG: hypothetical protein FWD83_04050 [Promicromonosporaceae bacterium]|nr:hypothetical protein [Promicromonosporaceae bacterium]
MSRSGELTVPALLDVLDELASSIEGAKPVFMSSDVRLNRDDLLSLIDELRRGLPAAITKADSLLSQAQDELADARRASEETLVAARQRAIDLVEQEQVVAQAKVRAAEIVTQAEQEAEVQRYEADLYCDKRLLSFQSDLDSLSQQVQAGRAKLAERLGSVA